jgi:glycosyltransferase involved in cell wall biosynthesis
MSDTGTMLHREKENSPGRKTALVSVVVPTYNRAAVLGRALASVRSQEVHELEVIVVDDGSTDETQELVCVEARRWPKGQVICVHQRNQGPSKARNVGIARARGKYIAFLDSDDVWLQGSLWKRVSFLERNPQFAMVLTDMVEAKQDGIEGDSFLRGRRTYQSIVKSAPFVRDAVDLLVKGNFVPLSTVVIRAGCLEHAGLFDESLKRAEDRDLWLRVAQLYNIAVLPEVMLIKYQGDDNLSTDLLATFVARAKVLRKVIDQNPRYYRAHKTEMRARLAELHRAVGEGLLRREEVYRASQHFRRSLVYRPAVRSAVYFVASLLGSGNVRRLRRLRRAFRRGRPWGGVRG